MNDYGELRDKLTDVLLDNGGNSAGVRFDFPAEMLDLEQQCTLHYLLTRMVMPLSSVQTYSERFRSGFAGFGGSGGGGGSGASGSGSGSGINKLSRLGINPSQVKQ